MSSLVLSRRWSIAWAILFMLNVLASMVLGWTVSTSLGIVGMVAAVALHYGFGVLLLRRAPAFGKSLVVGSVIPFLLQFVAFFFHFAGALLAIGAWHGACSLATILAPKLAPTWASSVLSSSRW